MCGICGRINFNSQPVDKNLLHRMCDLIKHRGPDSEGLYLNSESPFRRPHSPFVGMGIRRLAIIDLNTGDQPIHNENKTIWTVFNGEIYNFKSLRQDLEKKGHSFYTQTDTEVIVHLYEEHGPDFLKFLRGMFAIALWDGQKKELFLARDRVGKKPLCYSHFNNTLVFASELKSLLINPEVKKEIDPIALDHYLTYQYVPAPMTIFKTIRKLPPASYLICNARGQIKINRYWNLPYEPKLELREEEYSQRLLTTLKESVSLRLISDVPLGVLLSGGIDSSLITALMSREMSQPVKTFSIGFEESDYSELPYARTIAERFQTEHHEFIVKPDAIKILPELVWHYNEPYADSSMLPTYYVARETRKFVTVALNGDGGDESFAGYQRYYAQKLAQYYAPLFRLFQYVPFKYLIDILPSKTVSGPKNFFRRLKRFLRAAGRPAPQRYLSWCAMFDEERKKQLCTPEFLQSVKLASLSLGRSQEITATDYLVNLYQNAGGQNLVDRVLATDVHSYLPEDLLVKMDIATMANSLEGRSPFLDHQVMELAARMPAHLKLKGSISKYILKKTIENILPDQILRRPKMGFGIPIHTWFRTDLKDYLKEVLFSGKSLNRGYFQPAALKQFVNDHIEGRADHGYQLWGLLTLELWFRIFIDGDISVEET